MAQIRHCRAFRRTQKFWLNSRDDRYRYQILLVAECPACGQLVLEMMGIFHDGRQGQQERVQKKHHEEWIGRTDKQTGDIAEDIDSSAWESVRNGVYWVYGSLSQFPYTYGRRRVSGC